MAQGGETKKKKAKPQAESGRDEIKVSSRHACADSRVNESIFEVYETGGGVVRE